MSSYKLTYFDIDGGRAEPVRIAFHAAGIPFEDVRLTFPEFGKMRSSTRFNSLPVLEIDGVVVTQTNAMCRYVGRMAKLYPDDDREALYCDEALEAAEDLSHRIVTTFGLDGDALKAARAKLTDGWLTIFIKGFDELLARGGGNYFADNRLTMADLKVSGSIKWLQSGTLDHVPTDLVQRLAPALAEHAQRIAEEPIVAAYYASRA